MKFKFVQVLLTILKRNSWNELKEEVGEGASTVAAGNANQNSIKLSLEINANINDFAKEKLVPLYAEVKQKVIDAMKQILENHAKSGPRWLSRCGGAEEASNVELISLVELLLQHRLDRHYDENWSEREQKLGNYESPIDRLAPLHLAIMSNNLKTERLLSIVSLLVKHGADVELRDEFGRTPLHLAVELQKPEVAKFLLIAGANVNCVTKSYSTPLHAALGNADVALIRYLLKHGARVEAKNRRKESTLHVAIRVIDDDKVRYEVVQLLLAYKVRINERDSEKSTALHYALVKEDFPVFYLLISRGSLINLKNCHGFSPLYIAVARNLLEEAKILLKLGANVNDCDRYKISILTEAVEQANENMIDLLLKYNANVSDRNSVLAAADNGNVNVMKILVRGGADVNVVDKMGLSVLVHAILFKHHAMVQYLLESGADINFENKSFVPLTYSFLLYNFNDFAAPNANKESYKFIMTLILKRIALMNSQNQYVHAENTRLLQIKDTMKSTYENCCRELSKMKKMRVSESTPVTYYDLLVKRNNALVQCLRCAKVRDKLLSGHYKAIFVEYSAQIQNNYNIGFKRWLTINKFETSLNEIFKSLLPYNVTYKICEYFSDEDIEKYFQNYKVTV